MSEPSRREVVLEVRPRVCLHDVATSIHVSCLPPHSPVTLRANNHDDSGIRFASYAHYNSDAEGCVDVEKNPAVGGSYTGVFPMGLLLTLREFPYNYTRHWKSDVTTPWKVTISVFEGHLTLEEQEAQGTGAASTVLHRHLMSPGMKRISVHHGRLRGALFMPPGPGPFPGVMDVYGGFGGLREHRAAMLACKGFATLALAYFNYDDLPKTAEHLELDYFEEATEFLLCQPGVVRDRCAVVSSSKGCEIALAMAIHLDKVKAVVCIGGLLIPMGTTLTSRGKELWKGVPMGMDFAEINSQMMIKYKESKFKEIYRHDHPQFPPCERAPDDTHFLIVCGQEDNMYTKFAQEAFVERMRIHKRQAQCHTLLYPGVGHILENPYCALSKHSNMKVPIPAPDGTVKMRNFIQCWGGEPQATCHAQEDFWTRLQDFTRHHVRDLSQWYQDSLEQRVSGQHGA